MSADNEKKGIILIVDDNPNNLGALFKFLSDSGFKVLVATDGGTALEQIEYVQHDLILLDIMMPEMDGFETCRRLKENPATQEIPVIFMTALSETVDKVKGFKLGAVDYITKPIQHEEVLVRVETHLTIRNLQKKLEDKNQHLQEEIVQRKHAEAVLQESEAKYRTLVEQIPAVTYIAALDDLCTKLYVSPRIKQMLGFSPEEWREQRDLWIKQIYPEDCQGVLSQFYLSQSSGKPFCAEYRILSKHGRVVWVRDEASLIRDDLGKPISFQGVMFNITAHKQAEEALKSSEAQNRALLNAIPDLMYSINSEGVFIDYMAAKDEHIVNSPEEFLNKNIAEVFSSDLAEWTMYFVREALATAKVQSGEYVQQVNGNWRCYDARYFAMEGDRVLVLVRDISERKQLASALVSSQAELKNKTEQLEETLMELRSTQSQLIHNAKMVGLGQLVAGIAHEINNPINFIYGNVNYAGQYVEDLLSLLALYQEHYPEPVSAIKDEMETIDLEFLNQDFQSLLRSMQNGVERIRNIVSSLRTFSNLDKAEKKRINIHDCLDSVLLIVQGRLQDNDSNYANIEAILEYGELPLVECYPGDLNQVFLNIIANAIDALKTPISTNKNEGETIKELEQKTIWIRTEFQEKIISSKPDNSAEKELQNSTTKKGAIAKRSGESIAPQVIIKIADNGMGISEEIAPRIFDPFFTTKGVGTGTGLGLFVSHQIVVKKHGGELKCVSTPGKGTEFIIALPKDLQK